MWLAKSVIPECNIDSCLFNVLLQFGKDGVNHTKGNTTVVKKVVEKFDNLFCVAVVDKDKRDIDFIAYECEKVDLGDFEEYFKLFKRKEKHDELDIRFIDFGINAGTLNELNYITKTTSSKNDERFEKLFKEFVRKSEELEFKPVLKLRNIVQYILAKQYEVDTNELKNA